MDWAPDCVLLDLMLPDDNGYRVCETLRQRDETVPIIILTAKAQESDKIRGLDAGADDYVTKPFSVAELIARINAIFRRQARMASHTDETFAIGAWTINARKHTMSKGRTSKRLTFYELEVLKLLRERTDETVSRDELLEKVWGIQAVADQPHRRQLHRQAAPQARRGPEEPAPHPHGLRPRLQARPVTAFSRATSGRTPGLWYQVTMRTHDLVSILASVALAACASKPTTPATPPPAATTLELGEMTIFDGANAMFKIHANGSTEMGTHKGSMAIEPGKTASSDSLPIVWEPGPTLHADGTIDGKTGPVAKVNFDAGGTIVELKTNKTLPITVADDKLTITNNGTSVSAQLAADGNLTVLNPPEGSKKMQIRIEGADTPGKRRTMLALIGLLFAPGEVKVESTTTEVHDTTTVPPMNSN